MTSVWVFLITFVSTIIGAVFGMVLRVRLPMTHLTEGTKEVIRLGAGLLATLSAVVISLMIASAKNSYDTQDAHFRQLAAHLVQTDQLLARYGPDAIGVRALMREAVPAALDRIWREKAAGASQNTAFSSGSVAEQIDAAIGALSPATDEQRAIKLRLMQSSGDIAGARLQMFADVDKPVMTPFLLILVFWLTVIFTSFSLFVEPSVLVATALVVFALSVSSALFLLADLSQPFAGLMQISSQHLREALAPLR